MSSNSTPQTERIFSHTPVRNLTWLRRVLIAYHIWRKCWHCTCSSKVIRLCEEPRGWEQKARKKQATWRSAIRQVIHSILIKFSSHLCVVVHFEMESVDGVLHSCNCRCVDANSKLHELVWRCNMLFCFYPPTLSLFRHVVWTASVV